MDNQNKESFNEVKTRLDQIVEAVSGEDISLDDALGLYEEAVKLGMQATSLLEENIDQDQVQEAVAALEETEAILVEQRELATDELASTADEASAENQTKNEAASNE